MGLRTTTSTIPIVCPVIGDHVGDGYAVSLARPGGNITGLTYSGPGLVPKRFELLKELVPGTSRVAVLRTPGIFGHVATKKMLTDVEDAARSLGVQAKILDVRNREKLDDSFSTTTGTLFYQEQRYIVDLAANHRLPSVYDARDFVEIGGLMAYGPSLPDLNRRAAEYVDKILKGAKVGDLPIEQPTKFEVVVNLVWRIPKAQTVRSRWTQMIPSSTRLKGPRPSFGVRWAQSRVGPC